MSDLVQQLSRSATADRVQARLKQRYAAERRFRAYGVVAIGLALLFLVTLLTSIIGKGSSAFFQNEIQLNITFEPAVIDSEGLRDPAAIAGADYRR